MTISGPCYLCGEEGALVAPSEEGAEQWGRWVCSRCVYAEEMGREPTPPAAAQRGPTRAERLHPQAEHLFELEAPTRRPRRPPS